MKTISRFFAPLALAILFFTSISTIFSQKLVTWKGGTPGMEDNWDCPKNWSTYAVPDGFSNVIIPDVSTTTFAAPVIWSGQAEVNSLFFTSDTKLTVEKGAKLLVYESYGDLLTDKNLLLEGILILCDEIETKPLNTFAPVMAERQ